MRINPDFPPAAKTALEMLHGAGFEAYLIGGSVRDSIMGKPTGDIDVTTNAEPSAVEKVFSSFRVVETGIRHGTVTVIIGGEPVEITTYRSDGEYSDNRHPDSISFSKSLSEDVRRRDFTMNAVAFSYETGYVDLTGGIEDIRSKTVRCIGSAQSRFHEDALRILRALRFSSVLGFTVDSDAEAAVHACKDLLNNISAERIREETVKLLCGENAAGILKEFPDVMCTVIPELEACVGFEQKNRHHIFDVYTHTVKALGFSRPQKDTRLALLFHDIGKPRAAFFDKKGEMHFNGHPALSAEMTEKIMTRLRFDNLTKQRVTSLVMYHDYPIAALSDEQTPDRVRIKKLMSETGAELCRELIEIKKCDNKAQKPEFYRGDEFYSRALAAIDEIEQNGECYTREKLAVNGADAEKLGFFGKKTGGILKLCLDAVIEGRAENSRKALLEFMKNNKE